MKIHFKNEDQNTKQVLLGSWVPEERREDKQRG
jgi:hypothetical protein